MILSGIGKCVVCGRDYFCGNHQCPPKVAKAKDAAMKLDPPLPKEPKTESHRLSLGFFILSLGEA